MGVVVAVEHRQVPRQPSKIVSSVPRSSPASSGVDREGELVELGAGASGAYTTTRCGTCRRPDRPHPAAPPRPGRDRPAPGGRRRRAARWDARRAPPGERRQAPSRAWPGTRRRAAPRARARWCIGALRRRQDRLASFPGPGRDGSRRWGPARAAVEGLPASAASPAAPATASPFRGSLGDSRHGAGCRPVSPPGTAHLRQVAVEELVDRLGPTVGRPVVERHPELFIASLTGRRDARERGNRQLSR